MVCWLSICPTTTQVWAPIAWDEQHPFKHHWLDYGVGYIAFYKRDMVGVGGYDEVRWGCRWGGEDTDLVIRFIKAVLQVPTLTLSSLA